MVKERRFELNPWPIFKQNHLFVKFAVSFLLMGLVFLLFYSNNSTGVSPVTEAPFVGTTTATTTTTTTTVAEADSPAPASNSVEVKKNPDQISQKGKTVDEISPSPTSNPVEVQENSDQIPQKEKCDIFIGDWIPDPSGPIYSNESCYNIEGHQNCMKNGRPDSGYLYWRWNPQHCELPRFNGERFLELMRHKSWAFIGDSIARNHVQSLFCILSKVEQAIELYHDEEYRSKRWHFPSYNFTLSVIWSPFLVKAAIFEDMDGVSSSEIKLHLDELDNKWIDHYQNFDYVVISAGKWFLKTAIYYENNTILGCHYCPGKNLTDFGFDNAFRKALKLVHNFIMSSNHSAVVLYRTATPDHFENGEWFDGGTCDRTAPFKEGEIRLNYVDTIMHDIELEEFKNAAMLGPEKWIDLKILDTTRLSLLRPDGHPGAYRQFHPILKDKKAKVQYDCLHWCLPGPIDSWNDLIMEMVMKD